MNYQIIFSTYNSKTGVQTERSQLEADLVALANTNSIQGFSLSDQLGYWAGELEQSHVLTLLGVNKRQAFSFAEQLKAHFDQEAVIVKPIKEEVYFI